MLSFGISHQPICITRMTEKSKMAATWEVSKWVFMDFRPLDCIFQYENVRPKLQSSQNAFFWYITRAYTYNISDRKKEKWPPRGRCQIYVFMNFRPLDCIFLYANVRPKLQSSQNAFFRYITLAYMYNQNDRKIQYGRHRFLSLQQLRSYLPQNLV